jgi:hypothetical protein
MKSPSRANRRDQRARLKKKRRFRWGRDLRNDPQTLSALVDTACPCSCAMCDNPRKFTGELTLQERRANQPDARRERFAVDP